MIPEQREARRIYKLAYRARPEVKAKRAEYFRAYKARTRHTPEGRAKACITRQAWRESNPERMRAIRRDWVKTPKGVLSDRAHQAIRRAHKRGGQVSRVDLAQLLAECTGVCPLCDNELLLDSQPYHFDHIVALANGGSHTKDNLQVTHAQCNLTKGAKLAA